jgi:hypothetical protein
MAKLRAEFVFKLVTRSTGARAQRAPSLDHEMGNHAMKIKPIVEFPLRQIDEIRHCNGSRIRKQINMDVSFAGYDGCWNIHFLILYCYVDAFEDAVDLNTHADHYYS